MTTTADLIRQAARNAMKPVLTPSAMEAAVALYDDLAATAVRHDVDPDALRLGWGVVEAVKGAWQQEVPDIDALALIDTMSGAAAQELGVEVDDLLVEPSVRHSPMCAYTVLRRQEQTPAWGPTGFSPLVVRLDREEWGLDRRDPWAWTLFALGGDGVVATVIAPPPGPEVAAEVGRIAAQALSGEL